MFPCRRLLTDALCLYALFVRDDTPTDEELADIAKEDKNLMDIIVSGEASVQGGRRGSFVIASRHRSSRSMSSRAGSCSPPPTSREDRCSKQHGEHELLPNVGSEKPSRGRSQLTRSLSSSSSSLQTLEEKRIRSNESSPGSRERAVFPYTRRSSQIRPLLSSIEASARAASEDRSDPRFALDELSGTKVGSGKPQ